MNIIGYIHEEYITYRTQFGMVPNVLEISKKCYEELVRQTKDELQYVPSVDGKEGIMIIMGMKIKIIEGDLEIIRPIFEYPEIKYADNYLNK